MDKVFYESVKDIIKEDNKIYNLFGDNSYYGEKINNIIYLYFLHKKGNTIKVIRNFFNSRNKIEYIDTYYLKPIDAEYEEFYKILLDKEEDI